MRQHHVTHCLLAFALVTLAAAPAIAGPPLVCHPYNIGNAASLPWDAQGNSWKGMRASYPIKQLTGETLALLTPATPIIVRMETLRRAALYATKDQAVARALLTTLLDRAKAKGAERLASFDAGYLAETFKQVEPFSPGTAALAAGIDGYAMVAKSLAHGPDPAIEFAAAMITADGHRGEWAEHVRVARSGASTDHLLARNIGNLEQ